MFSPKKYVELRTFDGTVQYSTHIQTADERNVLEHAKKTKLLLLTSALSPTPRSICHTEKKRAKGREPVLFTSPVLKYHHG